MRQESKATRGVLRHRAVYAAARLALGGIICKATGFSYEPYKPKSGTFILLANHTSDMDPVYEVIGLKRHMRFLASENVIQGFGGKVVQFLAGPIPRRKGASADEAVDMMLENLQKGVSVGIHPEGNRTWDGETCYIPPRTARLVKDAPGGLITYRIDGGYLKTPRWAAYGRRGRIHGHVINEYTRAQLDQMSAGQIYEAICRDLYADAFSEQESRMLPYRGRNLAEGLENVLLVCPECGGIGAFTSRGDTAACSDCGYSVAYTEHGFFAGDRQSFKNILEWSRWQKRWLRENAGKLRRETGVPITADHGLRLTKGLGKRAEVIFGNADAFMYGDRLEVISQGGSFVFPLSGITKLGAFRLSHIGFTFGGAYYDLFSENKISGNKYFALWRILTEKDYF